MFTMTCLYLYLNLKDVTDNSMYGIHCTISHLIVCYSLLVSSEDIFLLAFAASAQLVTMSI